MSVLDALSEESRLKEMGKDANVGRKVYIFQGQLKGRLGEVVATSPDHWTVHSLADTSSTIYHVPLKDMLVL